MGQVLNGGARAVEAVRERYNIADSLILMKVEIGQGVFNEYAAEDWGQGDLVVSWAEPPRPPGHVFYDRLQRVLTDAGFDAFGEVACKLAQRRWVRRRWRRVAACTRCAISKSWMTACFVQASPASSLAKASKRGNPSFPGSNFKDLVDC